MNGAPPRSLESKKQIPKGNDRKKSKNRSKGKGKKQITAG
jgi:hypothetical protein